MTDGIVWFRADLRQLGLDIVRGNFVGHIHGEFHMLPSNAHTLIIHSSNGRQTDGSHVSCSVPITSASPPPPPYKKISTY